MIEIGDWITMPKYQADGDVIEISLNTVLVQNFDKTITSIPTYALISDSFINWRGMRESGGRRIKRLIHIDLNSVKFCDQEMLERFKKINYLKDYIEQKENEIAKSNEEKGIITQDRINGRNLTNIGTFRAYVLEYLRNNKNIRQDMTLIVRHKEPGENGLPIEIYTFVNDTAWSSYESIQADIFDHILAVIPEFDLMLFQNPTGLDFLKLKDGAI